MRILSTFSGPSSRINFFQLKIMELLLYARTPLSGTSHLRTGSYQLRLICKSLILPFFFSFFSVESARFFMCVTVYCSFYIFFSPFTVPCHIDLCSDPLEPDNRRFICVGACYSGESVSILRKKKLSIDKEKKWRKKSKDSSPPNPDNSRSYFVVSWNVLPIEAGGNRTLSDKVAAFSEFSVSKNEKIISISSHLNTRSVSVLLVPNPRKMKEPVAFKWLKFDSHDGVLLFTRICHKDTSERKGMSLLNTITVGNLVWFIFLGKASLWDSRYGIEIISIPLNIPDVLRTYYHNNQQQVQNDNNKNASLSMVFAPTVGSSLQLTSYYLTVCIANKNGASLFNTGVTIPTPQIQGALKNFVIFI